ncbi:CorA family divalent cation transporter [Cerasicoccus frondis]|uniref:CorA family divalent cation transporter n=1 Tax=Cerasicoccus frondis TaxID=490090 RepID=UPI00285262EE|nr:CorA family divalent cation transporter [Cerasicoccus frondis]
MITRTQFKWQLPPAIEARLGDATYGRQRTIFEDGHLLIILHEPPGPDDVNRTHKVFWRKPDGGILCNGHDNGERQLKAFFDEYDKKLKALETIYDEAKDAEDYFKLIEELLPLQRATTNTYNTLQAAREQVRDDRFILEMRDRAYTVSRNFELLLGDAKMAMDFRIARKAEEQVAQANMAVEAQHRLNILAAVFFPLTAIATIFGMNLVHGFEGESPLVFWVVFIVGLVTGLVLKSWVVSQKK